MALSDIFTVPFLVSLGITLLLAGLLGMFFIQRLQEQNHKMASMLGLVSTMAEELNYIRGRLQMVSYSAPHTQMQTTESQMDSNLIPVSDGEDGDESDDDDSDDSDEDDDSDSDSDDSTEELNTIIELNPNPQTVKIINFGELVSSSKNQIVEELDALDESDNLDDDADDADDESSDNGSNDLNDINDIDYTDNNVEELEELGELEELKELEDLEESKNLNMTIDQVNMSFIKSIDISNLEEPKEGGHIDYKKMSLNKLKDIAIHKGLISEPSSKITKNAILKMLEA